MFFGTGSVKFRLIFLLCSIVDIYGEVHVTNFEDVWEPIYGKIIHTSVVSTWIISEVLFWSSIIILYLILLYYY